MIKLMIIVNYAPFYLITDPDLCGRCYLHRFYRFWQALRVSGTTFVRKVCMKFEYICKPVFCEHNLLVEATYIHVTKLGRKGPMTCFTKIHNPFFSPSDSIKGSFAIDTQMPIVIFFWTICIVFKLIHFLLYISLSLYRVAPQKTEQSIFLDFALINSYPISLC